MKKIDGKDRKILYELDINSRRSVKALSKKLGMNKGTINYRIRNMEKNGIITRYFAEVNIDKLGFTTYKVYLQFQNVNEGKEKEIFDYLTHSKRTLGWIVTCSGRWDMIFGVWCHTLLDFNKTVSEFMNKFSPYILNKAISTTICWWNYNRKWLINSNRVSRTTLIGGKEGHILSLDKKEHTILRYLSENAKYPINDIAHKLNISSSLVVYKIKELEKKGVIVGFSIGVDRVKIGYEFCKSFIYLQNKTTEKEQKLIDFCAGHPNVTAVTQCIGSWDLEIEFEVKNFEEFYGIMKTIKNNFPELVKSYESVLISKEYGVVYLK